ncbi:MAG: hypothetical protein R3E76_16685 [Planctomycetota bacterium]
MLEGMRVRSSLCYACGQPAAGECDRCIFCGSSLLLETVSNWRSVYHPYSYADALLANSTLLAHGLTARLRHSNVERVLMGHVGSVIEVAEGEHLAAQEVLRKLRGVRTDTEYLEWQELKRRRGSTRRMIFAAMAAVTASVAIAAGLIWVLDGENRFRTATLEKQAQP